LGLSLFLRPEKPQADNNQGSQPSVSLEEIAMPANLRKFCCLWAILGVAVKLSSEPAKEIPTEPLKRGDPAHATAVVQEELKVLQLDPAIYQEYAGNFQIERDRIISIGPFSEAGGYPVFFDSKTRRFGVLYPVLQNQFVTGTLHDGKVILADLSVTFERSAQGAVSSITWREGTEGELRGPAVTPHKDEEVAFQNGDVTLHGTLTLPASPSPHPVVILLHEAGLRSRPFGMWPYLFAHYGIAMLTFDKRGSGASNGN
jgi:hypothetical protein